MNRFFSRARHEMVLISLGVMDVCVIGPLFAAILSIVLGAVPLLPVTGLVLAVILGIHYVTRLGLRVPVPAWARSVLLGIGMLASALFVVHRLFYAPVAFWHLAWLIEAFDKLLREGLTQDVAVFLLIVFLWWRGIVLTQRRLDSESVAFRFRLGVVMLAVTVAMAGIIFDWALEGFVFVFFFVSLTGIALARAEEVSEQREGSQSPFGWQWLAMIAMTATVILVVAAGLSTLITGENLGRLALPSLSFLRYLVGGLLYLVFELLDVILRGIVRLLRGVFKGVNFGGLDGIVGPPAPPSVGEPGTPPLTPEQLAMIRTVGTIGGILLLLAIVAFSLRKLRARRERDQAEVRESVWEGMNLRQSLADMLQEGRERLGDVADTLGHSRLGRLFAAMTIRRIYALLNALAAEQGYPRAPQETPYEYLPVLIDAYPAHAEDLQRITDAYVAVHYGEIPESAQDLELIRWSWDQVRREMRVGREESEK